MTRYQPRSLAPLPMSITTDHTLRPVIEELRAAQTASRYSLAHDPAVDAAARGLLSASCLSGAQLEALQARLASEYRPIADRALWEDPQPRPDPLPIGMIEPPDDHTDPALAALAEVEAAARALAAMVPRSPTLLQRLLPTTATAFWMAVSVWLGFLLARAEGWL